MGTKSEEIDRSRRRFSSLVAVSVAAAQFSLVHSALADTAASDSPAGEPGGFVPGFTTDLVKTSGTTINVWRLDTDGSQYSLTLDTASGEPMGVLARRLLERIRAVASEGGCDLEAEIRHRPSGRNWS